MHYLGKLRHGMCERIVKVDGALGVWVVVGGTLCSATATWVAVKARW